MTEDRPAGADDAMTGGTPTGGALAWRPERLRVERRADPLGVGTASPLLDWRLPADAGDDAPEGYQVRVATSEGGLDRPDAWDSGWVTSGAWSCRYGGRPAASRERLCWQVRIQTATGQVSGWSAPAWWEAALLRRRDWLASWIRPGPWAPLPRPVRSVYLARRRFDVPEQPIRARLYVTALGCYEAHLNGQEVGDGVLRPGWTDYNRRVQYQVIDVTDTVRAGTNVLGAMVAPGWFAGRISSRTASEDPVLADSPTPELLCQLEIELPGSRLVVATDERWQWRQSAIVTSDLYDGEHWDLRQVEADWDLPAGQETGWLPVETSRGTGGDLVAERMPPVRAVEVRPAQVTWRPDGSALVDSGANDSGFVRLEVDAVGGQQVEVAYGEIVDPAGNLYRENLRGAKCTDQFTCAGGQAEELAPRFSFRGFRYAEVHGLRSEASLRRADAVALCTDLERTGWFDCSEELLNRIYAAICCSQRANYLEVPTDCPQRDERLGWMADALLFAPMAAYNYDVAPFFAKWFDDVLDARTAEGSFTDIAPRPSARWWRRDATGAPAWADAGVLLPWLMYQRYGEAEPLEKMFPAMMDWLRLVHAANPDGIWRNGRGMDYGDWVPIGADTPHDLFGTAWLYHSTTVTARIAALLGAPAEQAWLADRAETVHRAFLAHYVDEGTGQVADHGRSGSSTASRRFAPVVAAETQAGYVVALMFGLVTGEVAARAGGRLIDMVRKAGPALETGFTGSALMLHALERAGAIDTAYDLLLRREPPSLGFMIEQGATSIWERWDGIGPDGWPACPTMNSFNHYAMGSMGSWLVEGVCGLRPSDDGPAFAAFGFAPAVSSRLGHASYRMEAPHGPLRVGWRWDGPGTVLGEVEVPAASRCRIASAIADDRADGTGADLIDATAPDGGRIVGPGVHQARWTRSR
jgi:alpha-L-rhamnosidase